MTLLAFIIVLGVLVIVHEWGHFAVARAVGVRVETFSIGFGPQLAAVERGGTVYKVCAVPLGGYVKMAGEDPDAPPTPDGFFVQPARKRAAIVLAGALMNLVFAFAAAPVMYMLGVPEPAYWDEPGQVGWVDPAFKLPLERGATIVAVDGAATPTWREVQAHLAIAGGPVRISLRSAAGAVTVVDARADKPGALIAAIQPPMDAVVERVLPGGAAESAGLKRGDRIVSIDGRPVGHWLDIRAEIDAVQGRPVTVVVARDGAALAVTLTPRLDGNDGRYLIGIARRELETTRRYGSGEAVVSGVKRVFAMIGLTFNVLQGLFTGHIGLNALGGPLLIAEGAGNAARAGPGALLTFMVFISVQLAVLNLLPIPVLDGGHLLLLGIEAVRRKRVPDRFAELAQWIGLGFLILLMLYVTRNDVMRIWGDTIRRWFGAG